MMKIKILLYWLPLILWMAVIFQSSSQTYHEQDLRPWLSDVLPEQYIKDHFSNIKLTYDGNEISIATKGVTGFVEFIIRKTAHIVAFTILSFLLLNALWHTTKLQKWLMIVITLSGSFLYACSDELHQMFTGDRTPMFLDVIIDMVGAVIGIGMYLTFRFIKNNLPIMSKDNI